MRFETTPSFDADVKRLKPEHRATFMEVVRRRFVPACDRCATQAGVAWPASLRVKPVVGGLEILEMTWSFSVPDGRATFELVTIEGELRCRWRRVGDHNVFTDP